MKKVVCGFGAALALLVCSFHSFAIEQTIFDWKATPYLGVDLQSRRMLFEKEYSMRSEKPRYLEGSFYAGLGLSDFFALEMGYQRTQQRSSNPGLAQGELYLGDPLIDPNGTAIRTKTILKGYRANVIGFLPVQFFTDLKLLGTFGFSRAQLKTVSSQLDLSAPADGFGRPFTFQKRVWMPRLGLGLQKMMDASFGIRALVTWEKTSKFGRITESRNTTLVIQPQNSVITSLGVFYTF